MSGNTVIECIIPPEWTGKTVDSFLRNELKLSRSGIRTLKKNQGIFIGGSPVWSSFKLQGGEQLKIIFPCQRQFIQSEAVPLTILYEDNDIIVLNKPAGQVTHPVRHYQSGTLANGLVDYWRRNAELAARVHPVHRLDRLTSGIILIAKSGWAHQQLTLQLGNKRIHRLYLAVCEGVPTRCSGKISLPVRQWIPEKEFIPGETPGVRWTVDPLGKPAVTHYRVLRTFNNASCLAVKLMTGRTHQIRVHLSHSGFPLWGDTLYGGRDLELNRPALHALRLIFFHPRSRERLKFCAEIPPDFDLLLKKLAATENR